VLVLLLLPGNERQWTLVVGFSRSRRLLGVQGPLGGLQALPEDAFAHCWEPCGRLCMIVTQGAASATHGQAR
jgi:hypothetical protein